MKLTDMHYNLGLYAGIALFGFLSTQFGTDEAAKFVKPIALWWLKLSCGAMSATLLAVKLFLSTSYSDWQAKKNGNGNGGGTPQQVPPANATAGTVNYH